MWATVKTTNQHLPSTRATQRLATEDLARFTVARLPALLTLALLTVSFAAEAQPPGRVYRIGYLRYYACAEPAQFTELRQGLRELGYAEGHNLVIECRGAPGQAERIPDLATELVRLNVDVIVAEGTVSALAAKQATRTIPIVAATMGDPVRSGLTTSLAHPDGNLTGMSLGWAEVWRVSGWNCSRKLFHTCPPSP
jgi:putative ABC transport system substrate-binding protein